MHVKLASAPVSWGVVMKDTPNVPPYRQVLDEICEAGYTGTELGPYGYLPLDPARLQDELDSRGLTLLSAFVIVNFIDPQALPDVYEEAITTVRLLSTAGCELVTLSDSLFTVDNRAKRAGRIRSEDGLDEDGWRSFGQNLNEFAKMCDEELGLKAAFHPHVGALIETGPEVDRLMRETDPRYVGLCLDTAHCLYGGDDPVDLLKRWADRVRLLHLKECDKVVLDAVLAREGDYFEGVTANVFPELGQGSVDFAAFRAVLTGLDFNGWGVIEQDILPGTGTGPLASARRNREYLQQLGYSQG